MAIDDSGQPLYVNAILNKGACRQRAALEQQKVWRFVKR